MARYRVQYGLTGYVNGQAWPEVGGFVELPEDAAASMVDVGHLELVKAAKPPAKKAEKRPAAKADVETR